MIAIKILYQNLSHILRAEIGRYALLASSVLRLGVSIVHSIPHFDLHVLAIKSDGNMIVKNVVYTFAYYNG